MPYYRSVGEIPRKRHTQMRSTHGTLYTEEGMGVEGFGSDWSLLYHRRLPTAITAAVAVDCPPETTVPNHPLTPRHLRTHDLEVGGDPVSSRHLLMANADVRLSVVAAKHSSPLFRNAVGDEVFYIEEGSASVETTFGSLDVGRGDYVVIPTSTTHRWVLREDEPLRALVIEATGHVGPADRYLTQRGQFTEQAPFCERDLRSPREVLLVEGRDVDVLVKNRNGLTKLTYQSHPFDVVGWDGCLYPYAFNVADFEPITGRLHQPPPVHQTFQGPNFVICSFVPRKLDYHPLSIPLPYNHSNVDSDEVLFYVGGDYTSRAGSGIGQGSISLHPSGFVHGPQPGAVEASLGKDSTDELAIMVDTFRPLELGSAALDIADDQYAWSWLATSNDGSPVPAAATTDPVTAGTGGQ